ncbi:MAG: TetR/AcrR family transcriptional regulator, partial [Dermatophilaceae bacterium]
LIFYHFHTVTELLEAASNVAVDDSVRQYQDAFSSARSLPDLLAVGRQLHERERGNGNVALMAQLMAGAQHDPVLARATQYAMAAWTSEIAAVLGRAPTGSPVVDLIDIEGLAHVISAGFIGIELYDGVNTAGASRALSTLEDLGHLLEVVNDLGPVATRAFRAKIRTAKRRPAGS